MMMKNSRFYIPFLFLMLLVFFVPPALSVAPGSDSSADKLSQTVSASGAEDDQRPELDRIDEAGNKVGEKIEQLGKKASDRFGGWINGKLHFGISWIKLLFCLLLIFMVVVVERLVRFFIHRKIDAIPAVEGQISWIRLILRAVVHPLSLVIWVYGIYGSLSPLYSHFQSQDGTNLIHLMLQKIASVGGTLTFFWFVYQFVNVLDVRLSRWAKTTESTIDDILVPLFGKTLRIFIVILAGILVVQNLTGVEIGPLLASMGIGGLAVALAAKDSIANFFGTLTILFDKPFQVGERILIDNYDGVVEDVGFRSTRIRLLTGNLVTIPNEKVVNSGLENIGKRPNIRWLTNIGITYDTPPEKIEKAVDMIREILVDHEGMHPDFPPRVYFNGFNDWSLNIMVIAWYHPAEYWDFQEWVQQTCLAITRRFSDEGVDFAFPTQTLYLAGDKKRQRTVGMLGQPDTTAHEAPTGVAPPSSAYGGGN
jgi:MscS family membrane protein